MKYYAAVYKAWKIKIMVLSFLIPLVRFISGMFIGNIHEKKIVNNVYCW